MPANVTSRGADEASPEADADARREQVMSARVAGRQGDDAV